jgi:glucan phosphoethanolaminetransferase (alkaline phosphatase superfamily)
MSIGLIIICNLFTIPFVYETETLGSIKSTFPSAYEVFKLANFLKTKWFYGYLVLLLLFIILWLSPSRSSSSHPANYTLIGLVLLTQALVWALVVYRIMKQKGVNKNVN